ncbi:MAG: hypothetical protein AB7O91_03960 [Sphingomonas sp.]
MDIPTHQDVIDGVDAFLARHPRKTSERQIGIQVMNDPSLIGRLRRGGTATLATLNKLAAFMVEFDRDNPLPAEEWPIGGAGAPGKGQEISGSEMTGAPA